MKHRRIAVPLLMLALLATTLTVVSPPAAAAAPPEVQLSSSGQPDGDHVIVETFTLTGERTSTEAFSSDGSPILLPADFESQGVVRASAATLDRVSRSDALAEGLSRGASGSEGTESGGSSSRNGCRKVTVRNERETTLGFTAYWFNIWTSWCWNRPTWTVSDVNTGWHLDDVDPLFKWRGLIVDNQNFYQWQPGYSRSGYRHEKQGHFENCVLEFGCLSSTYPRNILWSHSDGTWSWSTWD